MYFDSRHTPSSSSDEQTKSNDAFQSNHGEITRTNMQIFNSINNREDGLMTFKLYENVKSRPIPEEEVRGRFRDDTDYVLSCFSLTGSLANLTRFPYLAYTYDGCSFLVQFLILVLLIGVPWCFMETALGQYSGRGPEALGDMVPIGKGVAFAMGYICLLNVVCYSPIQARCLLYMYWSVTKDTLPWKNCSTINNPECIDDFKKLNITKTKSVGIELRVPTENFYLRKILNLDKSILYDGLNEVYFPLWMCLVISWIVNFCILVASENFIKKVRIFGSIAPFTFLFILLMIIVTDENAWGGFYELFDTNKINFLNAQSWRRAAEQVMYSLDVGTGHMVLHGQNCDFQNDILKDILMVTLLDIIFAVMATLVLFGTANIIACKFHIAFQSVFISGPGIIFIVISEAVKDLPFPKCSSFLSFFVLFSICILTQLSYLRPMVYLLNVFSKKINYNLDRSLDINAGKICFSMFFLSIITATGGGDMLISLLEETGCTMGILMITTFEAILIFGIYGINEFCTDLIFMNDHPPPIILKILFVGGPVFIINIMILSIFYVQDLTFQNIVYPTTAQEVAWLIASLTLFILIISAAYTMITFLINKNFYGSFKPTDQWVPDLVYSLKNNKLEKMTGVRDQITRENSNYLLFGFGKPRLFIKIDVATQTNEANYQNLNNSISNQKLQHFYLEVLKIMNKDFELKRKHNENQIIAWDDTEYTEKELENGFIEKYVQTD